MKGENFQLAIFLPFKYNTNKELFITEGKQRAYAKKGSLNFKLSNVKLIFLV